MIAVKPSKLSSHNLLPVSQVGNVFSSFFPYLFKWIYTPRDKRDWHTETRYPLSARTLWDKHQDKRQIIGVRFGEFTEYCMIDIDRKSPNHPLNSIANYDRILQACFAIGLDSSIIIRSSGSEGIHIYFPLEEKVKTFSLACGLRKTLEDHGLEVASGILETFPNTKTFNSEYKAHRLPLQDGSYICRNDVSPITNSVERFVDLWMSRSECNDLDKLTEFCQLARENFKPKFANCKKINQWQEELEIAISQGWTGKSQTNSLLFRIAEYGRVFLGYTDLDKLIQYVADTALQSNGFKQFSNHLKDLLDRSADWCKWIFEHRYPMQSKEGKQTMTTGIREKKKIETVQRIRDAANSIGDRTNGDEPSIKKLANAIAKSANCSLATLYKNLSLWHPDYKDTVTANFIDSQPDLIIANQLQETATNQALSMVTHSAYEGLEHAPNPQESLKFATPPLQPISTAPNTPKQRPNFFTHTEIKLLEAKVFARLAGRTTAEDLREVEDLRARILVLKRSLQE